MKTIFEYGAVLRDIKGTNLWSGLRTYPFYAVLLMCSKTAVHVTIQLALYTKRSSTEGVGCIG